MSVILGVCSRKEIPAFRLMADLLLDEGRLLYASSGDECILIEERKNAPQSNVKNCVGVAVGGDDWFYFNGEGGVSVGVGETYERSREEFAKGILEASEGGEVRDFLRKTEAEVAALLLGKDCITAVRDEIGCRVLYYGSKGGVTIFSNRKSVVARAGFEVRVAPAGSVIRAYEGELRGIYLWRHALKGYEKSIRLEEAVEELSRIFKNAVLKRSRGRVGVLFSGGLDSTLIVSTLCELGVKCKLYCSGVEGSKDVENAILTGEEIGLEVKVRSISEEELEAVLPTVVGVIGGNVLNVELAIPLLFALDAAREDGCDRVMNGTGADELFGGYSKFVSVLKEGGYEALQSALTSSFTALSENDLVREEEVAGIVGVLLRRPFLDARLVEYAIRIPPQYKVTVKNEEYIRKYILRIMAEHFHTPRSAVERRKLAFQYGSGVDKALRRIALKKGFTRRKAKELGFRGELEHFLEAIKLKGGL
ncbi:MAG: asparagine synthase-related protein [Candidatus Jordarchaeales archaeon]|nr:asparagine synthetase B [Candidatus Jordarchaeia archaeon]